MVGRDLLADRDQVLRAHAELGELALRLDLGPREVPAHRLAGAPRLGRAGAELHGGVAVTIPGPLGDDLDILHLQDGDRHLPPVLQEQPGHAQLLG
jgi:hypothetical protein